MRSCGPSNHHGASCAASALISRHCAAARSQPCNRRQSAVHTPGTDAPSHLLLSPHGSAAEAHPGHAYSLPPCSMGPPPAATRF